MLKSITLYKGENRDMLLLLQLLWLIFLSTLFLPKNVLLD